MPAVTLAGGFLSEDKVGLATVQSTSSVYLHSSIDLAHEHVGRIEADGAREEPEGQDHEGRVAKVEQRRYELNNVQLGRADKREMDTECSLHGAQGPTFTGLRRKGHEWAKGQAWMGGQRGMLGADYWWAGKGDGLQVGGKGTRLQVEGLQVITRSETLV